MAQEQVLEQQVLDIFEAIAEDYDAANDRISLGRHRIWKQALVDRAIASAANGDPGMIVDVCCGTGDITEMIARANPGILVVGIDASSHMLDVARKRTSGLENVMLFEADALCLPFDDASFDSAVISFGLRNTTDYRRVLAEMVRVVRAGGTVCCLDASVPDNPFVQPAYHFYYKYVMTFLGGGLSERARERYEWLYRSTQQFLRKNTLIKLMRSVGLEYVTVRSFMCGAAALHVGVKHYKTSVSA